MSQTNNEITSITFEEARSRIQDMNMVNNFLFDRIMEDDERAKRVASIIISAVLGYEVVVDDVESQKVFGGIDKGKHGIRLDAYVGTATEGEVSAATVFDFEMEDREADRNDIPKRFRYYSSIVDCRVLNEGETYDKLPNFISITVLSYDPFLAGDMYYETRTIITSHPEILYDDGRLGIFLYAGGNYNIPGEEAHGKIVEELVKFIVTGEITETPESYISELKSIVDSVKKDAEVTKTFMQRWDREMRHDRELTEQVTLQVTEQVRREEITNRIKAYRKHGITDEDIYRDLIEEGNLKPEVIKELMAMDTVKLEV